MLPTTVSVHSLLNHVLCIYFTQPRIKIQIEMAICSSLSNVYCIIKSLQGVIYEFSYVKYYLSYFNSRMKYGIIFWGRDVGSVKLFHTQKKVILLLAGIN